MADKIDMSLDDIIKKNKRGGRGGSRGGRGGRGGTRGRGAGGARKGGRGSGRSPGRGGRRGIGRSPRYSRGNADGAWSHDLYEGQPMKRGGITTTGGPAKLVVSNLDFGVSDSDIHELFSDFGHLKQASVHYDRSGRSLGTADVVFDRKSDAIKAMKQYDGVPLDGRAMSIQFATSQIAPVNSSPRRVNPSLRKRGSSSGGRIEKRRSGGGGRGRGGAKVGTGRGGRRGNRGGKKAPPPSLEELDQEMDTYNKMKK